MAKALIIVESPAKAKTISKFVGRGYKVMASAGHLRDLPKSKLGVDVDAEFTPQYVTIKGKATIIKELRDGAKQVDKIFLAPDPDREGEAIAWHLAHLLSTGKGASKDEGRISRLTIYEITKQAVQDALKSPRSIDLDKVNAQQARRIMDRLVGYLVSPVLWQTIRYGLSAGRVQSVALRMICDREKEIEAFVPQEYWTIEARLKAATGRIQARLERIGDAKPEIRSEAGAKEVLARLHGQPFRVAEVRRQERRRNPLPPFITSTLQQEAYNRLHFSSKKTMALAQQLYEGVNAGEEGTVGLITYMRTDSVRIADEAVASARALIPELYPAVPEGSYLPDEPPVYRAKAGVRTQDAHEAVRPTDARRTPEALKRHLTPDLWKLYDLIWKRFMASQMSSGVDLVTSVDIKAGEHLFRASGTHIQFDGFRRLHSAPRTKEEDDEEPLADLPSLELEERLHVVQVDPHQHFTEPPPRYTEGSLVKALEENGIGRPSTYATIVTTIATRDYVRREGGQLIPTELGRKVTDLLVEIFPGIFDVAFTASMENELDRVESGDDEWVKVLRDFYGPFSAQLSEAKERREELRSAIQEESEHVCEQCGARLVKKFGRNGPFLACPNYPTCRYTRPLGEEAEMRLLDEVCPTCGGPMVVRRGRFGRFAACSNYPNCKTTGPIKTGAHCPQPDCPGQLVERTTRRGRLFFGCGEYPKCRFATWDRPVPSPCPQCSATFRVEKETKAKGRFFRCLSCQAEEPVPASATA
jgi:DNA topoisomerase-1